MCCFMSSFRGTKTLVALREAPGVSWLGCRQMEKRIFFSGSAKKYWDELCTAEAEVSFELFCLHCASDKVIWLLVFLVWCLLSPLYASPQSILTEIKDAVFERKVLKICFQWKTEQCEEKVWHLKGNFQQVWKSDMQITL